MSASKRLILRTIEVHLYVIIKQLVSAGFDAYVYLLVKGNFQVDIFQILVAYSVHNATTAVLVEQMNYYPGLCGFIPSANKGLLTQTESLEVHLLCPV